MKIIENSAQRKGDKMRNSLHRISARVAKGTSRFWKTQFSMLLMNVSRGLGIGF
jgi:hypothetical protein